MVDSNMFLGTVRPYAVNDFILFMGVSIVSVG